MYLEHVSLSLCFVSLFPHHLYMRRKSWVPELFQAGKRNLLCSGPLCFLVKSGCAR